jgi:hypothetical protein
MITQEVNYENEQLHEISTKFYILSTHFCWDQEKLLDEMTKVRLRYFLEACGQFFSYPSLFLASSYWVDI